MILKASKDNIRLCCDQLHRGELVVIPTETVYGLAADATNSAAVAKIYNVKQRPSFNPLIVHYSSLALAEQDVIFNQYFLKLFEKISYGPLTFVLPKKKNSAISEVASAGLKTLAFRFPDHNVAKNLLDEFQKPIVAPSANPSGRISPTSAKIVEDLLADKINYILDGGECNYGIESTIIDLSSEIPTILRYGAIAKSQIEEIIGVVATANYNENSPKAPGMLLKHYSPNTKLKLIEGDFKNNISQNIALLAFGEIDAQKLFGFKNILNLSPKADLLEAAKNLFNYLHILDKGGYEAIYSMLVPDEGVGIAINDKLKRASEN